MASTNIISRDEHFCNDIFSLDIIIFDLFIDRYIYLSIDVYILRSLIHLTQLRSQTVDRLVALLDD